MKSVAILLSALLHPLTAQVTKEAPMENYTLTEKQAITIVGIKCRTSNDPEAGPLDIPKLWGQFFSENIIAQIPHKSSNEVIALYCDYEGDYTKPYTVVIGCPVASVDSLPAHLVAKTIPAGTYALFQAVGEHPKTLIETWNRIWQTPLKRSYTGDFEVYGDKFSKSPQEVEVFIAL